MFFFVSLEVSLTWIATTMGTMENIAGENETLIGKSIVFFAVLAVTLDFGLR